mmetsp:Transcript_22566/g.49073  ORF Transcript_22566/g.49073 Transcript_22566/m.49073 type:complete len:251 (-) Transcript_22566:490-1242(-)
MAAVIGRGIERFINVADGSATSLSDDVYNPSNNDRGLQSPFAIYYTITFFTNGIAILGGVFSQFDLHRNNYYGFDRCDAWLFGNAFFGVIHIGAATYLVRKIRAPENATGAPAAAAATYGDDGKGGVYVTGYRLHNPPATAPAARNQPKKKNPRPAVATNNTNTNGNNTNGVAGPPDSLRRIRYTLCENKVFAAYLVVFFVYVCWHFFLEMRACNLGMAFAMRCSDIFIWAAPCSFAISVATLMHRQGRL